MTIVTQNILKKELQISDPLIFIDSFKQQLASYRGQISELVKFLSQNSLKKTPNQNCNSTLQITPVSIKVQKNMDKCININQFYGRYIATNYLFPNVIMCFMFFFCFRSSEKFYHYHLINNDNI